MSPAALTLFSFFIPLLLLFVFFYFSCHRHHFPYSYPIIGNLIPHLNGHRFHDWVADLLAGAPTSTILVRIPFFSIPGVCTVHPAAVDHLRSNFPNYVKGARFRSHLSDLLDAGIFVAEGHLWSRQRKAASPEFSSHSLRAFVAGVVRAEVAARLLPALLSAAAAGRVLDLDDLFRRFAFDSICIVAFGEGPACLTAGVLPGLRRRRRYLLGPALVPVPVAMKGEEAPQRRIGAAASAGRRLRQQIRHGHQRFKRAKRRRRRRPP